MITDEWKRWQQGGCLEYAVALMSEDESLRFGALVEVDGADHRESHFFAHDDEWAYDSAGAHRLPYYGVHGQADLCRLDDLPGDYDAPGDNESVADALAHVRRHDILSRSVIVESAQR